jgi:predicted enzyme related to lactoylglutathione lyase
MRNATWIRRLASAGAGVVAAAGLAASCASAQERPQQEIVMPAPIVFFDIAGPDTAAQSAFYSSVFGWDVRPDGGFATYVQSPPLVARGDYPAYSGVSVSATAPLAGQLRADPTEKRIYVGVPDVAATLNQIAAQGGMIDAPRFEVPGVVVLGLFRDPAGNAMGLIEMDGDRVKVP